MKIDKKELLKVFLPILLNILKRIIKRKSIH